MIAGEGLSLNRALNDTNIELSIYFSESGWTDTYNCERWMDEVFIPYAKTRRVDPNKPILLTMDGHDTHEKPEIQRVIYKQPESWGMYECSLRMQRKRRKEAQRRSRHAF